MMDSTHPKDVEAFGAEMPMDNQEKQLLRERDHQAVSRPDPRPRTMATRRRLLLALLMCFLATIGFVSTYHVWMPCHEGGRNVEQPVVDVEHSSLSSLLGSSSVESLREVLEKYAPGSHRQQENAQIARRQAGANSSAVAVTTAVSTVSTPGPTEAVTSSEAASTPTTSAEAATTPTTSAQAATTPTTSAEAATTPTTSAQAATTPTTSAEAATTPTTTEAATTPTSARVDTTTDLKTTVATSIKTTTAIQTPSETSASSASATSQHTTLATTTAAPSVTPTSTETSTAEASSSQVLKTYTSTMADGGISVVTQTSYSYVNAEPTAASTSTRPAASLQTENAAAAGIHPGLSGGIALAAGLSYYLLGL